MKIKPTAMCLLVSTIALASVNTSVQGGNIVAPLLIDDFSESLTPLNVQDLDGTFPVRVGAVSEGTMLGGELDALLTLDGVENPGDGALFELRNDRAVFTQDASSSSRALLIWDGVDGDPVRAVASTGLGGGLDLTQAGTLDGIDFVILRNDLPLKISLLLFTGIENNSEQTLDVPVVQSPTPLRVPFSDLIANGGEGADLTRVTTVIVGLGAFNSAVGPAHLEIDGIQVTSSTGTEVDDPALDVLVDQIHDMPSSAIWSLNFPGDNPWDAEAADDFEVPAEQSWQLLYFDWAAEWLPVPPPHPTANVTIYANDGHVPGDAIFTQTDLPITPVEGDPLLWQTRLPVSWPLGEGRYWCSIQANVPTGFEMLIKESSVGQGAPYVWRNPGGAFGTFCSSWEDGISCNGNEPSLALRLLGTSEEPCTGSDLVFNDITYKPPYPRAGEAVTVEVTITNQGCAPTGDLYVDWFANLVGPPSSGHLGDWYQSASLSPGESQTLTDSFIYNVPGCYDTYARISGGPNAPIADLVHGPTSIRVASANPQAHWFNVQATTNRMLVTDDRELMLFDETGQLIPIADTRQAALVRAFGNRFIVIDGHNISILDANGQRIGAPINTQHIPQIHVSGDRMVVVDGYAIAIYDKDGHLMALIPATTNPPVVATSDDRIVVVDGMEIGIYDRDGHQIGAKIVTSSAPKIFTQGDRILVVDGNVTTLYDRDNHRIGAITTTHPPRIYTTGDRIVVIDGNEIKLYDTNGQQQGDSITTRNRPAVSITGNRIVVVDGNEIRLFDKDGNQIGSPLITTLQPVMRTTGNRIVVVDGNEIRLYDETGTQIGSPISTASSPRLDTAGDRILVIENNQIRIFDPQGNPLGGPIPTTNPPIIRTTNDRILIIDGNELNIYNTDGKRISGPNPLNTRTARLMPAELYFAPGELEKVVWLPLAGPGSVLFESDAALSAEAYDSDRNLLDWTSTPTGAPAELQVETALDYFVVSLSRPPNLAPSTQQVEFAVQFDDPCEAFTHQSTTQELMIHSPLRAFPGGEEITEVPAGTPYSFFDDFVQNEFGYSPVTGILGWEWLAQEELPYTLFPPAGHPAAGSPPGAVHNNNYCGISTFIHSMESTFPGALPANVTTNAAAWDTVGNRIDHSNTFGTRGKKMVDNINKNYGATPPVALNGKRYCAKKIGDTSPANLAAWAEDCNLKVLIYDFLGFFAHWADVTSVTLNPTDTSKATMSLQDYALNYNVGYSSTTIFGDQIDFSGAPLNSVMRSNFDGWNTVAGDGRAVILTPLGFVGVPTEIVGFSVVCEVDPKTGMCPTTTKSGKTLNP